MSEATEEELLKIHLEERKKLRKSREALYAESRYKDELNCEYHGGTLDVNCKTCISNLRERVGTKKATK